MINLASLKNGIFHRSLFLAVLFFIATPIVIVTSLFSINSLSKNDSKNLDENLVKIAKAESDGLSVYGSLPSVTKSISGEAISEDARAKLLKQYLKDNHSPLENYSNYLVDIADKYSLDYRLLTAIAQKESNICKIIPHNTYNCWGWGIHSQGTLGFDSYSEGIETVSKGIKENYYDQGYDTIEKIMSKYTPLSNGSWAEGVNKFMNDIENPQD